MPGDGALVRLIGALISGVELGYVTRFQAHDLAVPFVEGPRFRECGPLATTGLNFLHGLTVVEAGPGLARHARAEDAELPWATVDADVAALGREWPAREALYFEDPEAYVDEFVEPGLRAARREAAVDRSRRGETSET